MWRKRGTSEGTPSLTTLLYIEKCISRSFVPFSSNKGKDPSAAFEKVAKAVDLGKDHCYIRIS
jgi:hypothetical protein